MPDRYSEWDAYRMKQRSEPVPPDTADDPVAESYPPAIIWASSMYAEDAGTDVRPPPPEAPPSQGASRRSMMRPVLLGIASVTVLAALIAAPVVTHLTGRGSRKPSGAGTHPAAPPLPPSTTGPGCGGGAYKRVGFYKDGKAGWLSGSGGFSGAGCDGKFDALPMSGDAKKADPKLYAQWAFDPKSGRQCTVAIFIPNDGDEVFVGGSPALYTVRRKKDDAKLLSFGIDQPRSRGRWVSSAAFTADGPFYVRLANTGKDWTDTKKTFTHVAAAQARAVCG
ncbi:hypothetical protein [Actinomadura sp. DC4]|uniref:hypothetical protein n=1 Tax=Actinomadura sp. DC4 TaxID=3055069 RepID=UPI0025B103A0|nr:hypothetical protein [Actinomadura sp. DC4]MDN3358456.1 hypothetical protein [Actinomadura sp. DC4]